MTVPPTAVTAIKIFLRQGPMETAVLVRRLEESGWGDHPLHEYEALMQEANGIEVVDGRCRLVTEDVPEPLAGSSLNELLKDDPLISRIREALKPDATDGFHCGRCGGVLERGICQCVN
ncbi:MAG: hypothetical protein H5T80_12325 [Dietzia sp.]|nr:hypothetical protein [Dietzia sp.]